MKGKAAAGGRHKLSVGEILSYSFGLMGVQFIIGYMNSYQAQYYKAIKGSLISLSVVGVILLAAKIISAFADPFIGKMIDQSRFKSGKLKPFVLIGGAFYFVMTTIIFLGVPSSGFAMYFYIFITFLLWSISMSMIDIPSQGMLSVMSSDNSDRNNAAGVANLIKGGGFVGCFVIVPVVCIILKTGDNAMGQKEYFTSAVFMIILSALLIALLFFKTKERVPYHSSTVSTKEMFRMMKDNKPMMLIFLSVMLGFGRSMSSVIQVQAAATLIGTVRLSDTFIVNGENAGLVMGIGTAISSAISGALMPVINKHWGEKKTFYVFAVYGFIACTASYLVYYTGHTSLWTILISLFFVGFSYGPNAFLPLVMTPDCVDYYELKTGKRTDGICFSVLSLANKLSGALSIALGLLMVGISGYRPNGLITQHMRNIIYATYILIPGICSITAMLPMFSYKLVGKEKQRISAELETRHAAAAGGAGAETAKEN